eukprot:Selendium_serpulae@DN5247_c0_g1_i1.p1
MDEMRAMLDTLMGADRNEVDSEKANKKKSHFSDPEVCKMFLVAFCPHELFPNTRASIGPCDLLHSVAARQQLADLPENTRQKYIDAYEDQLAAVLRRSVDGAEIRIRKAIERVESTAATGMKPSERQTKIDSLKSQISETLELAADAGDEHDIERAAAMHRQADLLVKEVERLGAQHKHLLSLEERQRKEKEKETGEMLTEEEAIKEEVKDASEADAKTPDNKDNKEGTTKKKKEKDKNDVPLLSGDSMTDEDRAAYDAFLWEKVCPVCGAMQSVGDTTARFESHVTGKLHQGYELVRNTLKQLDQKRRLRRGPADPYKSHSSAAPSSSLALASPSTKGASSSAGSQQSQVLVDALTGRAIEHRTSSKSGFQDAPAGFMSGSNSSERVVGDGPLVGVDDAMDIRLATAEANGRATIFHVVGTESEYQELRQRERERRRAREEEEDRRRRDRHREFERKRRRSASPARRRAGGSSGRRRRGSSLPTRGMSTTSSAPLRCTAKPTCSSKKWSVSALNTNTSSR